MRVERERIQIGDLELELRSPEIVDARMCLEHLTMVHAETEYLQRYYDEVVLTLEEEEKFLQAYIDDPISSLIGVFHEGHLVGIGDIRGNAGKRKERHKAGLGISIRDAYTNRGIGRVLMKKLIRHAREIGLEMITLGVFADNDRALHLYKSLGFVEYGRLPDAYRYDSKAYGDEIFMVLRLK